MNNSRIFNSPNLQKLAHIKKTVYQIPKLTNCKQHYLPQNQFCIQQNCPQKNRLLCDQCVLISQNSHNSNHKTISVQKIVPVLSQWLGKQWQNVQKEDQQIINQWRNTQINLNYCIDILKELLKQVQEKYQQGKQLIYLPSLQEITKWVYDMLKVGNPCAIVDSFDTLNKKYRLFSQQNKENNKINSQGVQQERSKRLKKTKKICSQSKKFSEKALIFSQQLAQTIDDKIHRQKRVNKIRKLEAHKIICLSNLQKKTKQQLQSIGQLLIELNKKSLKEEKGPNFDQLLRQCQNLKSLHINNQNGNIEQKTWDNITNQLQFLKNLKQLKLNLRAVDLKFLINLFKLRPNAIRHINRLYLKISDEPNLDLNDVSEFCNCFQLKSLFLTLTRDNINKTKCQQFFKNLRIHTSLTNLPMHQFNLNLSKNKLEKIEQRLSVEEIFNKRFKPIKNKSFQF